MHVVVDGYNVMHALPVEEEWPGKTFQDRRQSFLAALAAYAAGRSHRITVVFDGTKGGDAFGGAETVRGMDVRYSPRGVEGDRVVVDTVAASPRPAEALVVTSDRSLGDRVRSLGASVAPAHELIARLQGRDRGGSRRTSRGHLHLW